MATPRRFVAVAVACIALAAGSSPRISVVSGAFKRGEEDVVLLGGNYVYKAQPYYPDGDTVARDARDMAAGARAMRYRPSDNRGVVPCVRLGALFEAFMPSEANVSDTAWQARLEATVKAFDDAGVYVFLDAHQDGMATTNGGEGLPWWMTARMQKTAGSVPKCWSCRSSNSYIVSPAHPLDVTLPSALEKVLREFGVAVPPVLVVNKTQPWLPYSVGGNAGDPRRMNVGNVNLRVNNDDLGWGRGTLVLSRQAQNVAWRFFRSHWYPAERADYFDHYMTFVRYLCSIWERYSNVVAVELVNEPPLGGIPDLAAMAQARTDLFDFYAAVASELEADSKPTQAPLAIEDVFGTSLNPLTQAITKVIHLEFPSSKSVAVLKRWAEKGQLVVSFHWYPPAGQKTENGLKEYIKGARKLASAFGAPPIWLSEYFDSSAATAQYMSVASELGCGAVTYWHYVNTDFTQTGGWYKYPPEVLSKGRPIDDSGKVNWDAWALYERTVADGSYYGADITGANGGKMHILENVPPVVRRAIESPLINHTRQQGFALEILV